MSEQFSGTKEVSEFLKFDLEKLNLYIKENCQAIPKINSYEQFKGGQSNPSYLLISDNEKYVLRRKPPGKLLKSAHAVDREFKVLTALMPTEVPTPNTFHLCEDIGIIGTAFYIMEYCDGVIYWDPIASELHKDRRHHIFDEMNKGLHYSILKTLKN